MERLGKKKTVDFSPGSRCVNGQFFGIQLYSFRQMGIYNYPILQTMAFF